MSNTLAVLLRGNAHRRLIGKAGDWSSKILWSQCPSIFTIQSH